MSFSTASKASLALDDLDLGWALEEAVTLTRNGGLEVVRVAVSFEGSGVLVAAVMILLVWPVGEMVRREGRNVHLEDGDLTVLLVVEDLVTESTGLVGLD